MADFVAVLKKTIGTLSENTPEMREKVYEKARSTIEAKLAALNPPPPAALAERQRKALEDAIKVVRAEFDAKKAPVEEDDLDDVFAQLKTIGDTKAKPQPSAPTKPAAAQPKAAPAPVATDPAAMDPVADETDTDDGPTLAGEPPRAERQPRRRIGGMVAALVVLLVLAGGAYAVWTNGDDFARLVGLGPTPRGEEAATTAGDLGEAAPDETASEPAEEVAAAPAGQQPEPADGQAAEEPEKFTQRLLPDGSEVDEGPAGGTPSVGEGTSVAALARPGELETPAETPDSATTEGEAPGETAGTEEPAEPETGGPETPSVAVGQRAIFYEERTSSAQGSADTGSIVWSLVEESPGGNLPPEPTIRAEASIPGKDLQLRMTIRRNGDESLPASHIVEMIFLTPDGFEGGGISSVSRISFKETEQAAGNPLLGIPAKIADGFFLIALGDGAAEIETNTTLLRRQSWIDIPIVYESGRRALLSLEKGIPGDRVFEEAMRAWEERSSG